LIVNPSFSLVVMTQLMGTCRW